MNKIPELGDFVGQGKKLNYRQFFMVFFLLFITAAEILMDYVTTGFDSSIFHNTAYWVEMSLLLLSVTFVALASRDFFRERELEQNCEVKAAQGKIKAAHTELINRDMMSKFEDYIEGVNNDRKLKAYKDYLLLKKFKAGKKKKSYWQSRIDSAAADIKFLKTAGRAIKMGVFTFIRYVPLKTSTVLAKVDIGKNDDDDLSANEAALVGQMLTKKLLLIIAMSFAFSTLFFTGGNVGLGIIVSTFMKLFRVGASAYTGASDGTSFIRHTLLTKMERRLDFMQKFLESERAKKIEPVEIKAVTEGAVE